MISPVRATRKPAPADTFTFLTVTVKSFGAPSFVGSLSAIDLCHDRPDLVRDGLVQLVSIRKMLRLPAQPHDLFCQSRASLAALFPYFGNDRTDAKLSAFFTDQFKLGLRILRETVYGDNTGQAENLCDVADMLQQIGQAFLKRFKVFLPCFRFGNPAVIFQRAGRRYEPVKDRPCGI